MKVACLKLTFGVFLFACSGLAFDIPGAGFISPKIQKNKSKKKSNEATLESSNSLTVQKPQFESSQKRTLFSGEVRLENMQYMTPVEESPELTRSQFFSGRFHYDRLGLRQSQNQPTNPTIGSKQWNFSFDLVAGTFFKKQQTHGMVNEVYGVYGISENFEFSLGRRKFVWSELDHFWHTGLWQPQFAIDALRPAEQGLSGAFANYQTEKFQALFFLTGIYIPAVGPDIREEDGTLKSESRWYRQPTKTFKLGNNVNSISYKLDIPEAQKLASQTGTAFSLKWNPPQPNGEFRPNGVWASMSAARKPVNELILSRNVFVESNTQSTGNATVKPEVAMHNLISADLGLTYQRWNWGVSYLTDQPESKLPVQEWASQKLEPLYIYSTTMEFDLSEWVAKKSRVSFGYLRAFEGGIKDVEADGKVADFTLFDQRLKFSNSFLFKLDNEFSGPWNKLMNFSFYYRYDWFQRGSLMGFETKLFPVSDVALLVGADFLGVENEDFRPDSFLNQYRANDRIFGGLNYVF